MGRFVASDRFCVVLLVALLSLQFANAFELQSFDANGGALVPAYAPTTLDVWANNNSSFAASMFVAVTLACNQTTYACSPVVRLTDVHISCTIPAMPPADCFVNVTDQQANITVQSPGVLQVGNRLLVTGLQMDLVLSNLTARPLLALSLLHPLQPSEELRVALNATTTDIAVCNDGSAYTILSGQDNATTNATLCIQTFLRPPGGVYYSRLQVAMLDTAPDVLRQFPVSDLQRTVQFIVHKSMVRSPVDTVFTLAPRTPITFNVTARELSYYDNTRLLAICSYTDGGGSALYPAVLSKFINPALVLFFTVPGRAVDEGKWLYCRWQLSLGGSEYLLPPPMRIYHQSSNTNASLSGSCLGGGGAVATVDSSTNDTAYSISLPNEQSSCTLTANASFPAAQIAVASVQNSLNANDSVVFGTFAASISVLPQLQVGANIIVLQVRSEAGNTRLIQLTITRALPVTPSSSSTGYGMLSSSAGNDAAAASASDVAASSSASDAAASSSAADVASSSAANVAASSSAAAASSSSAAGAAASSSGYAASSIGASSSTGNTAALSSTGKSASSSSTGKSASSSTGKGASSSSTGKSTGKSASSSTGKSTTQQHQTKNSSQASSANSLGPACGFLMVVAVCMLNALLKTV